MRGEGRYLLVVEVVLLLVVVAVAAVFLVGAVSLYTLHDAAVVLL